jgi:hypothetical protein
MAYWKDQKRYCPKCRREQIFTRCPNCRGKGDRGFTQCKWRCGDGYWCSHGIGSQWHK